MFELNADFNSTVHISGELLIQDTEEFYSKMQELLSKETYTIFDLSGLEAIDVSALQVLLSYKKSLQEENKFSLCNVSENVARTIKLTGFAKPLHCIV